MVLALAIFAAGQVLSMVLIFTPRVLYVPFISANSSRAHTREGSRSSPDPARYTVVRMGNTLSSDVSGINTKSYQRCTALTNAGKPCRSRAMNGSEFCLFHTPEREEIARRGGETSASRRSGRERFREDAERSYEKLFSSPIEAVEAEVLTPGRLPQL